MQSMVFLLPYSKKRINYDVKKATCQKRDNGTIREGYLRNPELKATTLLSVSWLSLNALNYSEVHFQKRIFNPLLNNK